MLLALNVTSLSVSSVDQFEIEIIKRQVISSDQEFIGTCAKYQGNRRG